MTSGRVRRPPADRGAVIVVAGPDGAGKSTVIDGLLAGPLAGCSTLRLHHRPHVLGALTSHDGPVAQPHAQPPRSMWLSLAKVLYLYTDYLVGWVVKVGRARRAGRHVLLERGWWDLVVDPARYRLQGVRRVAGALGQLLPRPDVTLVLTGDPKTLTARKQELPYEEIARQIEAWANVPRRAARPLFLDTTQPLDETLGHATAILHRGREGKWVGLPRRRNPRWAFPASPRQAARNAFLVYTPVTPYGRWAWQIAREAASAGGLRLLPACAPPDAAIAEALAPHAPAGFVPAIARSYYPGRVSALIMDSSGALWGLAKLAFDDVGGQALEREADAVDAFARLLPAPLAAPGVLVRKPGLLVFEAVQWSPRPRPWLLTAPAAHALGRFFRAGRTPDGLGPAHGDCAPWNLLRADPHLYLVDWADALYDAPPFYDVFHFLVQSHALLGTPKRKDLLAGLEGTGWVGAVITAYASGADVPRPTALDAFPIYLHRSVDNLDPTQADGRRGVQARADLLAALSAEAA